MATDFEALNREATERGMHDYERGIPLDVNPYQGSATVLPSRWREGWTNAYELDRSE